MLREETGQEKVVIRQRKRAWNLEDKLRRGEGSKLAQACLREILGRERREERGVFEVEKEEGANENTKWNAGGGQRLESNSVTSQINIFVVTPKRWQPHLPYRIIK